MAAFMVDIGVWFSVDPAKGYAHINTYNISFSYIFINFQQKRFAFQALCNLQKKRLVLGEEKGLEIASFLCAGDPNAVNSLASF